jgi:hypothetical protein
MEIDKLPTRTSALKTLVREKEKYYYDAIKNGVSFDKLTHVEESLRELRAVLLKKMNK